jgi:AcrR family transcriptional regulator
VVCGELSLSLPELPLIGDRPERGDAAANRARILCAARRLFAEHGVAGVSMNAVAHEAGVGKGTIFRRFGNRAGLTHALLDDYMRGLQDAIISGPPPLGPGAVPQARLEAFCLELVRTQHDHLELALAAEGMPGRAPAEVYGLLLVHVRNLVGEIAAELDADVVAAMILGAISPPVLHRLRRSPRVDEGALRAGVLALLRGVTGGR